jgi:mannose-6-phosphate isomerase
MRLNIGDIVPVLHAENFIEERPWGHFHQLTANRSGIAVKMMYVKRNEALSLQYHKKRDQLYLILDQGFRITVSDHPAEAIVPDYVPYLKYHLPAEDDLFLAKKGYIHRAEYFGPRLYGRFLDIAFGENDEEDIIRLVDKYRRGNGERS